MKTMDSKTETVSDNSKMSWFERLQLYTKDFNKEQNAQLARHIKWVKCEGIMKEGEEIERLIKEEKQPLNPTPEQDK